MDYDPYPDRRQRLSDPNKDSGLREYAVMPPDHRSRKTLQENIERLMLSIEDCSTNAKLAKKAQVGTGTISRLRNAEVAASADMIDAISTAFGVEPWQLLVPDLDTKNLPVLRRMGAAEEKLFERVSSLAREIAKDMKQ